MCKERVKEDKMEFRFNVSKIFKNNISRIGNSLLPTGFVAADRRAALWVSPSLLPFLLWIIQTGFVTHFQLETPRHVRLLLLIFDWWFIDSLPAEVFFLSAKLEQFSRRNQIVEAQDLCKAGNVFCCSPPTPTSIYFTAFNFIVNNRFNLLNLAMFLMTSYRRSSHRLRGRH